MYWGPGPTQHRLALGPLLPLLCLGTRGIWVLTTTQCKVTSALLHSNTPIFIPKLQSFVPVLLFPPSFHSLHLLTVFFSSLVTNALHSILGE